MYEFCTLYSTVVQVKLTCCDITLVLLFQVFVIKPEDMILTHFVSYGSICFDWFIYVALCGQVVSNPTLSNHLDGAQSAFQYFENVRNFLVAVEEMGLPSFEVSDLEQV